MRADPAEMPDSQAAAAAHDLAARLRAGYQAAPPVCDVRSTIAQLDGCARVAGYRFVPSALAASLREIDAAYGSAAVEAHLRLLLATLIADFPQRAREAPLTSAVRELLANAHAAMLKAIETPRPRYFRFENDLFAKDLGVARLKLLPCGAEDVDRFSGIPRRLLATGGPAQALRALHYVLGKSGGFKSWYECHWNRRLVGQFSERSYDDCYLRVAGLLEVDHAVRGLIGSSWWYDPQLEQVSPELAFLRRVPQQAGARLFRVGFDDQAARDALRMSLPRQQLHDAGKYHPQVFLFAWNRDDILRWARARRRESH